MVDLPVRQGKLEILHGIYISPSLGGKLITGENWLKMYNAVIHFYFADFS